MLWSIVADVKESVGVERHGHKLQAQRQEQEAEDHIFKYKHDTE